MTEFGNYPWLDEFLLALPGAERDYQAQWQATRYLLRGKMFAMLGGDKAGKALVSMKLEPQRGEFLRRQYPGELIPGYYMNKVHWNSLYLSAGVPAGEVKAMLAESHSLILAALPKKAQAEIAIDIPAGKCHNNSCNLT